MKKEEFLKEIKKLGLPSNSFAIHGSGPLTIRGLKETNDVDIIARKELFEKLSKKHGLKTGSTDCIEIGVIEVFSKWKPDDVSIDKLIDEADIIEDVRFVRLEEVKRWKQKRNLEKDRKDIILIDDFLKKK
ncbi:hypothetical protein GOV05_01045 [Candidatus Woesearchaeota archaeon]|nr:hypothetical protein [Candidatus Woesearchaeota archaeon]